MQYQRVFVVREPILCRSGLEQAALDVDTQNPTGVLRLYEKLGFEAAKRTITFKKVVNSGGN